MLFATPARPAAREQAPAIVHVDGSARPQTVSRDQNPQLYALLEAFKRRTGVPLLLNTSFNDAGEPIVETPADALRTFLNTELDYLYIDSLLVAKRDRVRPATHPAAAAEGTQP
jgi:carbamoyltransferase